MQPLVASSSSPGSKRCPEPEQGCATQQVKHPADMAAASVKRRCPSMRTLDVPQEKPAASEELESSYYPSTSIPIRGWLQPCRYCRQWTSGTVCTNPDPVPVCKRCQGKLADYFKAVLQVKRAQQQAQASSASPATTDPVSPSISEAWSSPSTSPSTLALETSLSI